MAVFREAVFRAGERPAADCLRLDGSEELKARLPVGERLVGDCLLPAAPAGLKVDLRAVVRLAGCPRLGGRARWRGLLPEASRRCLAGQEESRDVLPNRVV